MERVIPPKAFQKPVKYPNLLNFWDLSYHDCKRFWAPNNIIAGDVGPPNLLYQVNLDLKKYDLKRLCLPNIVVQRDFSPQKGGS